MKLVKSLICSSLFSILLSPAAFSQDKPAYWNDIQVIKNYDAVYPVPGHPVLFIGSSSVRLWVDFNRNLGQYNALNRGIGGAVTPDVDRYLNDIVFPYHPRQIVIYVGENDLLETPDAAAVADRFKKLYTDLRSQLPDVPVIYLSIKGSPSRAKYFEKAKQANELVKNYIKEQKNIVYLDVFHPMLDKQGNMRPELFKEDMLHMNARGYAIWNKVLQPHLLKIQQ